MSQVLVVGAGLAGCEAAWQLAERDIGVVLVDQKPETRTPAQSTDGLAELVCSNSLRGSALSNAVGLLKEELRRAGSLVMRAADATSVPAGGALAVDRESFSAYVTAAVKTHPGIRITCREIAALPEQRPVILATGPLTSERLALALASALGQENLAYYDAIAPIVSAESIDLSKVFRQSRYDKGTDSGATGLGPQSDPEHAVSESDGAYLNCPMDESSYHAFVAALRAAEKVPLRDFEKPRYFEGCLPIEVMAERGEMTLAFGPMKPVGLLDPRTQTRPFAVVQLRQEDDAGSAYNLVGFQTRMTYREQARILRSIPGLEQAEFLRFGSVHRNTFLNAPELLDEHLQLKALPSVFVAGQLSGVEGYVESGASGLLCGLFVASLLRGDPCPFPPRTTALGGLLAHLAHRTDRFQPSNINWSLVPALQGTRLKKRARYEAMAQRALADLAGWLPSIRSSSSP